MLTLCRELRPVNEAVESRKVRCRSPTLNHGLKLDAGPWVNLKSSFSAVASAGAPDQPCGPAASSAGTLERSDPREGASPEELCSPEAACSPEEGPSSAGGPWLAEPC